MLPVLLFVLLSALSVLRPAFLTALQTADPDGVVGGTTPSGAGPATFPSNVTLIVRVDGGALAGSPLLPQVLRRPEAENALARALARPDVLSQVREIYVGLPASFTPASTELAVLLVGSFGAGEVLRELARAEGVERTTVDGLPFVEAGGSLGTTYATPLGDGALAVGDVESVRRMVEVWRGERDGAPAELRDALAAGAVRDVSGAGRLPVALRDYLKAQSSPLAAPLATIDRVSFDATLDRAMQVRASLQPASAEGRQAIEQALGALRLFGPSRFADDPEVLSLIQSLRFTVGRERVELTLTAPRSLLLELF